MYCCYPAMMPMPSPSPSPPLSAPVDWQVAAWWAQWYNSALYMQHINKQHINNSRSSNSDQNSEETADLEQDEREAIDGLMSMRSIGDASSATVTASASKNSRKATSSVRRAEVVGIFGKDVRLPIQCIVNIEVDGVIVSRGRQCEIRRCASSTGMYMTHYDRQACIGMYDNGIRLARTKTSPIATIVRVLSSRPL